MSELLGTTIEELIATMKERRVRIPSEIGAFIALEVCEAMLDGPATVRPPHVRVADDGSISVFAPPGSATSEESARSLVALLGGLLVAAGTGVPRVLVGLLEGGPSSGRWDLSSLRDDLEASLVPLNRAAARRVLARMLREARKPRSSSPTAPGSETPAPGEPTLDSQLDDLLGPGEPGPPSIGAALDATLAGLEEPAPAEDRTIAEDAPPRFEARDPESPKRRKVTSDAPTKPGISPVPARAPVPEDSSLAATGVDLDKLGSSLDAPKRGSVLPWILAFFAIVAATAAAVALSRPDLVDAMLGRPPPPPPDTGPTAEEREEERRGQMGRYGTLTIQAIPAESQILLYVGHGPAEADELPVGVAHEFVAIAEGRVPSRAFIPADAEWSQTDSGMRYELALQAGTGEMAEADLDLGPTTLMRDALGAPTGVLGTARVITNPPGAKVYLLVGYSPTVVIENATTTDAIELLIYHEGHPVAHEMVRPSGWTVNPDGSRRAQISIVLEGAEEPPPE